MGVVPFPFRNSIIIFIVLVGTVFLLLFPNGLGFRLKAKVRLKVQLAILPEIARGTILTLQEIIVSKISTNQDWMSWDGVA